MANQALDEALDKTFCPLLFFNSQLTQAYKRDNKGCVNGTCLGQKH